MANKADVANLSDTDDLRVDKTDEAIGINEIVEINETNMIVEIVSANEAIAINRAIVVDRANTANKADDARLAEANKSLANGSIAVGNKYSSKLLTLLPFSLTKYFEIFAEVQGYFGLIFNNQPGGPFGGNEIDNQLAELEKLDVAKGRDE